VPPSVVVLWVFGGDFSNLLTNKGIQFLKTVVASSRRGVRENWADVETRGDVAQVSAAWARLEGWFCGAKLRRSLTRL
jgi:hypothetical protein